MWPFNRRKINELEAQIKYLELNNSLAGVVAGQWRTIYMNNKLDFTSHFVIPRCIDLKSSLVAQLPLKLYKYGKELPPDTLLPIGKFKFDINYPHPDMSAFELFKTCMSNYYYYGEMFIFIDDTYPFSIEPLNPKLMSRINGKWQFDHNSIDNSRLIYIKMFNPDDYGKDNVRGKGVLDMINRELEADLSALRYQNQWFKNFAAVGGHIVVKEGSRIRKKDLEALVKEFNARHANTINAGKTMGLPMNVDYKETKHSMTDADLLPMRKDVTERIMASMGVTKAILGLDQVNRSVTEEATRMLFKHNIQPDSIYIQQKINQQLMRKWFPGYTFKFDFSKVVEIQVNRESLIKQAQGLQKLGYTMNEINTSLALGMEDVTDDLGDTRFFPKNLIPADSLEDEPNTDRGDYAVDDNEGTPDHSSRPGPEPEPEPEKMVKWNEILEKGLFEEKKDGVKYLSDSIIKTYQSNYEDLHRKLVKIFSGKISKTFAIQLNKILEILHKKEITVDLDEFLDKLGTYLDDDKKYLVERLRSSYEEGIKASDAFALTAIGSSSSPLINQSVLDELTNNVVGINDTTYDLIKIEVERSIEAGETISMLADRIKDVFKANTARRRVIARTESGFIINRTINARYLEEGVDKKQWLPIYDDLLRESHNVNGSMGIVAYNYVYPNGQKFPSDGRGGASENIDCRCTFIPVIQ